MQPLNESLKEHDFFGIMSLRGRVEDAALDSSGTDFERILLRKIDAVSILKEQHETFRFSEESGEKKAARRKYKDRLFKFIFGNPDNKQWTPSLCNAMNGTDYSDPEGIRFNAIGDAVYTNAAGVSMTQYSVIYNNEKKTMEVWPFQNYSESYKFDVEGNRIPTDQ